MQTDKAHIEQFIRSRLPQGKQDISWAALAEEMPWYPMVHWLKAAEDLSDTEAKNKAALYASDILRLHFWLHSSQMSKNIDFQQESTVDLSQNNIFSAEAKEFSPDPKESEPVTESLTETIEVESASGVEPIAEEKVEQEPVIELTTIPTIKEEEVPESPGPVENSGSEEEIITDKEKTPEQPTSPLKGLAQMLASSEPVDESALKLEPYHTIDYFASQGIKISMKAGEEGQTPLDKQVKSFTDWLKSMKRVGNNPISSYSDPLVEKQAINSIKKDEIVTEAMAEVWVKQGKFLEAAQVYAKLMLQHPEKTHYFAAQLQILKDKQ